MKKILVLYYTQSGQLKKALNHCLSIFENNNDYEISYEAIQPEPDFPFPWKPIEFFDVFPESVYHKPCSIKPIDPDKYRDADLIIIGYQPWFLSPSLPVSSFLQSENAKQILRNKNVISLAGCRNMWIMAQEDMKALINNAGGKLRGSIVLKDRSPNLLTVISIMHWMFSGKQETYLGIFPPAGIKDQDFIKAEALGEPIMKSLSSNNFTQLQSELLKNKAIRIVPDLMSTERKAKRIFRIWARFILKKGGPASPRRRFRVKLFMYYLIAVIYLLSPILSILFYLTYPLFYPWIKRNISYYSSVETR